MRLKTLTALTALLTLSCGLLTGTDGDRTDWDWAYAIARSAVDDRYGEHWFVESFGAEYLDITGELYDGMTFPEWDVYFSDGSDTYLWVFIHEDGQFGIFELDSSYYMIEPLTSTYDSAYVSSWLQTASCVYREITGRKDDVCYELTCFYCEWASYHCDLVEIDLYDEELEDLGYIRLLPRNNEITEFGFES
jgi:hypothetical protein